MICSLLIFHDQEGLVLDFLFAKTEEVFGHLI